MGSYNPLSSQDKPRPLRSTAKHSTAAGSSNGGSSSSSGKRNGVNQSADPPAHDPPPPYHMFSTVSLEQIPRWSERELGGGGGGGGGGEGAAAAAAAVGSSSRGDASAATATAAAGVGLLKPKNGRKKLRGQREGKEEARGVGFLEDIAEDVDGEFLGEEEDGDDISHDVSDEGVRAPAANDDASSLTFEDPLNAAVIAGGISTTSTSSSLSSASSSSSSLRSSFPFDAQLNSKVSLWRGMPWNLAVDAVVNSTNERLDEESSSLGLHAAAGPALADECTSVLMEGGCRTGEARVTGAYDLPARRVIHTVGPRYVEKYRTAAENALSHCYRSCLEALLENELRSIAFPPLYSEAKGYPREAAAHVAIRTVRRFLERHGSRIDAVVFCTTAEGDTEIYKRLLPLYFPRDPSEAVAALSKLPQDTGDEFGAAVIKERQIRIAAVPGQHADENGGGCGGGQDGESSTSSHHDALVAFIDPEFIMVARDPDELRLEAWQKAALAAAGWAWTRMIGLDGVMGPPLSFGEEEALHARCLAKAKKMDMTELNQMKVVYRGGLDCAGRNVMVVVGAHFLPRSMDLESFLLYAVQELEPVLQRPFAIVYFHAAVSIPLPPDLGWMKRLHSVLGPKHRRNLQAIYMLHPNLALKATVTALRYLVDSTVWSRIHYVDRLLDLFRYVPRDQITIPEFVLLHDMEVNPQDAMGIGFQPNHVQRPRLLGR